MNNNLRLTIIRFIVLALMQIFVLNNIEIAGYLTPQLYVLFVALYPFSMNYAWLLLSGFALGLTIDIFELSGGLHAFSLVLVAGLRPFLASLMFGVPRSELYKLKVGNIHNGKRIALIYLVTLVFIHHTALYLLEAFGLWQLLHAVWQSLANTLITCVLCLIYVAFFYRLKDN